MPFTFTPLAIPEVLLIEPKIFADERGYFSESYKQSDFEKMGITKLFSQENQILSKKGTLRGLHYQLDPHAQGKLVHVAAGKVFDVAIDIRKGSPTFSKWVGAELSAENHHMLWIPPGFAHGVLILEDNTLLQYKSSNEYMPTAECSICWNDPDINISWPISEGLIFSAKDKEAPTLNNAEINYIY